MPSNKIEPIYGVNPEAIPYEELIKREFPVLLKGVLKKWPLVEYGLQSNNNAVEYLKSFYSNRPVTTFVAPADVCGKFFYNDDLTGRNFEAATARLDDFLDVILETVGNESASAYYVGSTDVDQHLPGLRAENDLVLNSKIFESNRPYVSIWIGNRTTAAAHYDMSNNIACCLVGRRRFTLFPPNQIQNLYPGPLERTPGGQVVSMVDFQNPDYEKYPRFREAEAAAIVVDLEPGDLLLYPAMWWHQVEALDDFNVMINYWWNSVPVFVDDPMNTLLHGLLSLRDRPAHEKEAWRELFEYYVFGPNQSATEHLNEAVLGALGPVDEMKSRRLRAQLLQQLNR